MNKLIAFILPFVLLACSTTTPASKPVLGKPEFEKMKSLAGTWKTTDTKHGKGNVIYRLTSAGNALEEILFPGTPHEMLSVYYPSTEGLAMTHYCALGNRPELTLTQSKENSLVFELSPDAPIDVKTEQHIHAVTLTFLSPTQIRHEWVGYENGKKNEPTVFDLVKQK